MLVRIRIASDPLRELCESLRRASAVCPSWARAMSALNGHCQGSLEPLPLPAGLRLRTASFLGTVLGLGVALSLVWGSGLPVVAGENPQVRLLFPVLTGQELGRLLALVPQATLLQINGQNYVLIGRFDDARVAHRLGRSLQARYGLPFDLAYDAGHPQLNLAWLRDEPADLAEARAAQVQAADRRGMPASPSPAAAAADPLPNGSPPTLAKREFLRLVEVSSVKGPGQPETIAGGASVWGVLAYPPTSGAGAAALRDFGGGAITLPAATGAAGEPLSHPQAKLGAKAAAGSVAGAAGVAASASAGELVSAPLQTRDATGDPSSPPADRATDPGKRGAAPVAVQLPPPALAARRAGGLQRQDLWDGGPRRQRGTGASVAMARAGQSEAPRLTRLAPVANPDLDYLFVRVADAQQLAELQRLVPVTEVTQQRSHLLARVGVFTRSLRGQLLLEQRLTELRQHRLQLLVARGGAPQAVS